jgi:hypothetical protein
MQLEIEVINNTNNLSNRPSVKTQITQKKYQTNIVLLPIISVTDACKLG